MTTENNNILRILLSESCVHFNALTLSSRNSAHFRYIPKTVPSRPFGGQSVQELLVGRASDEIIQMHAII